MKIVLRVFLICVIFSHQVNTFAQPNLSENWPYTRSYLPEEEAPELKNYEVNHISKPGLYAMLPDANSTAIWKIARSLKENYSINEVSGELVSLLEHPILQVKRNTIYIIGYLCRGGKRNKKARPFLGKYKDSMTSSLLKIINETDDSNLMDDALLLLDRHYKIPSGVIPKLTNMINDTSRHDEFRRRTLIRWVSAKKNLSVKLNESDVDFMINLLDTTFNEKISSTVAYAFSFFRKKEKIPGMMEKKVVEALENVYRESELNRLKIWAAYSIDEYNDTTTHFYDSLEIKYEEKFMNNIYNKEFITIVSGLPDKELDEFADQMIQAHETFLDFMGVGFQTPVPEDVNDSIILRLFPTMTSYRTQMEAWGHTFAAYAGGVYMEDEKILYTYQRTPEESTLTVEELIAHEFGHYLTGRYIFKGVYQDDDYDSQATVWADEGIAEFMAGMVYDSIGNYKLVPRVGMFKDYYCSEKEEIPFILNNFSYPRVYSFMYFMMTEHKNVILDILNKYRLGVYKRKNFKKYLAKFELTFSDLEKEWYEAMNKWCKLSEKDNGEKKHK